MEKSGIGRPATYAAIMENISNRDYVRQEKGALVPTVRGEKLVDALVGSFDFMDLSFTRNMEEHLDNVASGELPYVECVGKFHEKLMVELNKFVQAHAVACPPCGSKDEFRHMYSIEKGLHFWGCKSFGSAFATANGRSGQ